MGKQVLLQWLNTALQLKLEKVEDVSGRGSTVGSSSCGNRTAARRRLLTRASPPLCPPQTCSGAVACQLMDCLHPGSVNMKKVRACALGSGCSVRVPARSGGGQACWQALSGPHGRQNFLCAWASRASAFTATHTSTRCPPGGLQCEERLRVCGQLQGAAAGADQDGHQEGEVVVRGMSDLATGARRRLQPAAASCKCCGLHAYMGMPQHLPLRVCFAYSLHACA